MLLHVEGGDLRTSGVNLGCTQVQLVNHQVEGLDLRGPAKGYPGPHTRVQGSWGARIQRSTQGVPGPACDPSGRKGRPCASTQVIPGSTGHVSPHIGPDLKGPLRGYPGPHTRAQLSWGALVQRSCDPSVQRSHDPMGHMTFGSGHPQLPWTRVCESGYPMGGRLCRNLQNDGSHNLYTQAGTPTWLDPGMWTRVPPCWTPRSPPLT